MGVCVRLGNAVRLAAGEGEKGATGVCRRRRLAEKKTHHPARLLSIDPSLQLRRRVKHCTLAYIKHKQKITRTACFNTSGG